MSGVSPPHTSFFSEETARPCLPWEGWTHFRWVPSTLLGAGAKGNSTGARAVPALPRSRSSFHWNSWQSERTWQTNKDADFFRLRGFDNSRSLFSLRWRISKLPPPSENSESLQLFLLLPLVLFRHSSPLTHMLSLAAAVAVAAAGTAWMFSRPGLDLQGGISVNPSPTLPHSFITELLFYFLPPLSLHFPLCLFPPFFNPQAVTAVPPLFAFPLYFSLIFLSSAPFIFFFTSLTVPFVDYQIPSLSHAFTFNSCHPAPCFTASLDTWALSRGLTRFHSFPSCPPWEKCDSAPGSSDGWRFRRRWGRSEGLKFVHTLSEIIRVLPLVCQEAFLLSGWAVNTFFPASLTSNADKH